MKHKFRALYFWCILLAGSGLIAETAIAQTKKLTRQTNLASSLPGVAPNNAPSLINPWAIAGLPRQPFFIAESDSGSISALNSSGYQRAPSPFQSLRKRPRPRPRASLPMGAAFSGRQAQQSG